MDALAPYLDHLRELLFVKGVSVAKRRPQDGEVDARLAVRTPTGTQACLVALKSSHLSREVAERVVHLARERPALMLFAPHIGRDIGDLFARERVNFVDLSGNCHVRFGDQYLARVQGVSKAPVDATAKSMRAPSYAALLALLIDADLLDAPVRTIGAEAAVSPQTASDLRARLVEQGLVLRARGQHRWSPTGRRRALDLWLAGWASTLRPHLLVGRFRAKETSTAALEARLADALRGATWRWGGGAASQRLTGFYRGEQTVLYVEGATTELARRLAFVPDRAGSIELLRSPCPAALRGLNEETVHPLVVYADLLAEGNDRAREAAAEVERRYLSAEPA